MSALTDRPNKLKYKFYSAAAIEFCELSSSYEQQNWKINGKNNLKQKMNERKFLAI